MSELFTMHQKYNEFLAFMADCPMRKTLEHMELGFWVWLKSDGQDARDLIVFSSNQAVEVQLLKSENKRLNDELMRIKRNIAIALDYGAVGERGEACLAIDGGNL